MKSLFALLVAMLVVACAPRPSASFTPIKLRGTRGYRAIAQTFDYSEESALNRLEKKVREAPDKFGMTVYAKRPIGVVKEGYYFAKPYKDARISESGYLVNGYTGEITILRDERLQAK